MQLNQIDRPLRRLVTALAVVAGASAALLVLWPAASHWLWPTSLAPLHARCVGVMEGALAAGLWAARRTLDAAACRLPLAGVGSAGVASLVTLLDLRQSLHGAPQWPIPAALIGALALQAVARYGRDSARAERPLRGWQVAALLFTALGLASLAASAWLAARWPWPATAPVVAGYGPLFIGFGASAWLLAGERRRYVRAPMAWAFLALSLGVLSASALHHAAFDRTQTASWLWAAGFVVVAVLSLHTLQRPHRLWQLVRRWRAWRR